MIAPVIYVVPATVVIMARCHICQATNNAIVIGRSAVLTPSHCAHAILPVLDPPSISFSDTGE